jgi:hypothetical protein
MSLTSGIAERVFNLFGGSSSIIISLVIHRHHKRAMSDGKKSRIACCNSQSSEPWLPIWIVLALGAWGIGAFAMHMFIPSVCFVDSSTMFSRKHTD